MNRKQLLLISLAGAFLLAITAAEMVWSKAHVPTTQVQMCHKGRTTINVDAPALFGHLRHGDFRLPACDFANIFQVGSDCSFVSDVDGNGEADAGLNPRDAAVGTPGCVADSF